MKRNYYDTTDVILQQWISWKGVYECGVYKDLEGGGKLLSVICVELLQDMPIKYCQDVTGYDSNQVSPAYT